MDGNDEGCAEASKRPIEIDDLEDSRGDEDEKKCVGDGEGEDSVESVGQERGDTLGGERRVPTKQSCK